MAGPSSTPSLLNPASTPAHDIYHLSLFVMAICLGIFLVVFSLIVYAAVKYRKRSTDDDCEPPQIYGSNQVELAWTVIPILIVVVLFLAAARVIHAVEDAQFPPNAIEVTAIGHQFWWEFQYPGYGFVTANELHVPVSDLSHPTPTHIILLSADTDHSFWVPQLAGKIDLIPNRRNEMWIDPHDVGHYVGQCAQYCGTQHAKMLLNVMVDSPEDFAKWTQQQKTPAVMSDQVADRAQGVRDQRLHELPYDRRHDRQRQVRPRLDTLDEPHHDCRRRGAEYARESAVVGEAARTRSSPAA